MTALPHEPPVVSVVMPAFNAARTLQVAIDSVLSQTLTNLELLIGDDASTDETSALLATIKDPRVRVFTNASNLGPGPTRDHLIAQASGKWIAFFDADDAMHPDRLRQLMSHTEQLPPCILFDDIQSCHDTADGLTPWRRLRGPSAFGAKLQPVEVPFSMLVVQDRLLIKPLIPRQAITSTGVTHRSLSMGEDANFFLKIALRGLPLLYVPVALYQYRLTAGSLTKASHRHSNMIIALEDLLTEPAVTVENRKAIQEKVRELQRSHSYSVFAELLRKRRLGSCALLLSRKPWMLLRLVRRVARGQLHHLHRSLSAHIGRGSS